MKTVNPDVDIYMTEKKGLAGQKINKHRFLFHSTSYKAWYSSNYDLRKDCPNLYTLVNTQE